MAKGNGKAKRRHGRITTTQARSTVQRTKLSDKERMELARVAKHPDQYLKSKGGQSVTIRLESFNGHIDAESLKQRLNRQLKGMVCQIVTEGAKVLHIRLNNDVCCDNPDLKRKVSEAVLALLPA